MDGQLERAVWAYDRALEIEPGDVFALDKKADVLVRLGRPAEAMATAERNAEPVYRLTGIAMAAHSLGRAEESRRALDELVVCCAEDAAFQIAEAFAWRGEREKAFDWLERAYRQEDAGLLHLRFAFRDLRGDPRFAALLRQMNLPVD
jgi:tetratricopeptide (TPR) repeat protein